MKKCLHLVALFVFGLMLVSCSSTSTPVTSPSKTKSSISYEQWMKKANECAYEPMTAAVVEVHGKITVGSAEEKQDYFVRCSGSSNGYWETTDSDYYNASEFVRSNSSRFATNIQQLGSNKVDYVNVVYYDKLVVEITLKNIDAELAFDFNGTEYLIHQTLVARMQYNSNGYLSYIKLSMSGQARQHYEGIEYGDAITITENYTAKVTYS